MEDDSFKYLGHENLGELVAELRNKMGSVTGLADLIKLENEENGDIVSFLKRLKPRAEKTLLESLPLILQYLEEFEQYDLGKIKKK
jgi:hypothetical protein